MFIKASRIAARLDKQRPYVETAINWLAENGFPDVSAELAARLEDAEAAPLATPGIRQPIF